jgi:hypothetical protein
LAHPGPGTYVVQIDGRSAVAVVSAAGIGVIGAPQPTEGTELRVAFLSSMSG